MEATDFADAYRYEDDAHWSGWVDVYPTSIITTEETKEIMYMIIKVV